jgi:hypothetical protein
MSSRTESLYGRHTEVASEMNKEPSLLTGSDRITPVNIRKPFTIISLDRAEREAWFQPCRKWWFIKCKDRPNQILEQGVSALDVIPQYRPVS